MREVTVSLVPFVVSRFRSLELLWYLSDSIIAVSLLDVATPVLGLSLDLLSSSSSSSPSPGNGLHGVLSILASMCVIAVTSSHVCVFHSLDVFFSSSMLYFFVCNFENHMYPVSTLVPLSI